MAITTNTASSNKKFNFRYSAFLGMLYLSNPDTEAALKACREKIGEVEWKKGFKGTRGDSASAVARAELKAAGIEPVTVAGFLRSAYVKERNVNGRMTPYLNVSLFDPEYQERYYVSIDLGQDAAQMLARKLVNAKPGAMTSLSLFGTYEQKAGQDRAYANHAACLRQGESEVAGVNPQAVLKGMVDNAVASLSAAGITDKEIVGKAKDKVRIEYHTGLMNDVDAKFAQHYAALEQAKPDTVGAVNDESDGDDDGPY